MLNNSYIIMSSNQLDLEPKAPVEDQQIEEELRAELIKVSCLDGLSDALDLVSKLTSIYPSYQDRGRD